jgi:hypothetical protein
MSESETDQPARRVRARLDYRQIADMAEGEEVVSTGESSFRVEGGGRGGGEGHGPQGSDEESSSEEVTAEEDDQESEGDEQPEQISIKDLNLKNSRCRCQITIAKPRP